LITAAYDLQSRLYNILRKNFLVYVREDHWGRADEAVESTLFAFAQYFGWREILRREIQLLEFETRDIGRLLSRITGAIGSDGYGPAFLLWKAEQRAIGETMIDEWRGAPSCAGYAGFEERRSLIPGWADRFSADLRELAAKDTADDARLSAVQHMLVDLINELDPNHIRYAPERLHKA
jgi:hypothetical protein